MVSRNPLIGVRCITSVPIFSRNRFVGCLNYRLPQLISVFTALEDYFRSIIEKYPTQFSRHHVGELDLVINTTV